MARDRWGAFRDGKAPRGKRRRVFLSFSPKDPLEHGITSQALFTELAQVLFARRTDNVRQGLEVYWTWGAQTGEQTHSAKPETLVGLNGLAGSCSNDHSHQESDAASVNGRLKMRTRWCDTHRAMKTRTTRDVYRTWKRKQCLVV